MVRRLYEKIQRTVLLNSTVFSDEDFAPTNCLLSPKSANASTEVIDPKFHRILPETAVSLTCNKETKQPRSINAQGFEPKIMSESSYIPVVSDLYNNQD